MELSLPIMLLVSCLFFIVAFLYSSVGHGGASGYLAVLSFFAVGSSTMATTALMLNILVAGIAAIAYARARHFSANLTWPFLATSIPMAFAGGMLNIGHNLYSLLLAVVLTLASFRLIVEFDKKRVDHSQFHLPKKPIAFLSGGAIGLLSGIVGVGGGIFLSPLIMLMGWGDAKQTAATSAVFILLNSVAGLLGRALQDTLEIGQVSFLLVAAITGGYFGSQFGASKFSNLTLRRLLAVVLIIAALKLFITSL